MQGEPLQKEVLERGRDGPVPCVGDEVRRTPPTTTALHLGFDSAGPASDEGLGLGMGGLQAIVDLVYRSRVGADLLRAPQVSALGSPQEAVAVRLEPSRRRSPV